MKLYLLLNLIAIFAPMLKSQPVSSAEQLFLKIKEQSCESNEYASIVAQVGVEHVLFERIDTSFVSRGRIFLCLMDVPSLNEHNFYFYQNDAGNIFILTESIDGINKLMSSEKDINFNKIDINYFNLNILRFYQPLYKKFMLPGDGRLADDLKALGVKLEKGAVMSVCDAGRKCIATVAYKSGNNLAVVTITSRVGIGVTFENVITCENIFRNK